MTKENIFSESTSEDTLATNPEANTAVTPAPGVDPALKKRLDDKDSFIRQLIEENRELRLQKETINQLAESAAPAKAPAVAAPAYEAPAPVVSKDELASLVKQVVNQESAASRAQANLKAVNDRMVQMYGTTEKAQQELIRRAEMLGTSIEDFQSTAAKSPALFFAQMGINLGADGNPVANSTTPRPTSPDINVSGLTAANQAASASQAEQGTYKWFIEQYGVKGLNNEHVQIAMHNAAIAKGDAFFN